MFTAYWYLQNKGLAVLHDLGPSSLWHDQPILLVPKIHVSSPPMPGLKLTLQLQSGTARPMEMLHQELAMPTVGHYSMTATEYAVAAGLLPGLLTKRITLPFRAPVATKRSALLGCNCCWQVSFCKGRLLSCLSGGAPSA